MKKKTPTIRAKELFTLVYGNADFWHYVEPELKAGWVKLGKFVLSLETKWAHAKKRRR